MISARYAWHASGIFLIALIPTVLHVYRPAHLEPGALERALDAAPTSSLVSRPGRRTASFAGNQFGAADFVTRVYPVPAGDLELFAARSLDWKKLFHFPEIALARGRDCTARSVVGTGDPSLPVNLLEFRTRTELRMACYALVHDGRAVTRPMRYLLAHAHRFLFRRRGPMTLLYVQGDCSPDGADELRKELLGLIRTAGSALFGEDAQR